MVFGLSTHVRLSMRALAVSGGADTVRGVVHQTPVRLDTPGPARQWVPHPEESRMNDTTSSDPDDAAPLALPGGDPQPGLYRHYKGGSYRVLGLVRHSETLEVMVLYQALYGTQGLWVRPRAMFLETVSHGGATVPRFERLAGGPHAQG